MILLVGAGAVGSVLATYIAAAGKEPLRLYLREKDRAVMRAASRLQVESVDGDLLLDAPRPELVDTLDLSGVDYLLICVKFAALEPLLETLPPDAEFPRTCTIVSTLNGIEPLRLLRRRLPLARVVPMSVMFNAQMLGPLRAQLTTRPVVVIGGGDAHLCSSFAAGGMKIQRARGETAAWGKLLINLANAVCALTHSSFDELLTRPDLRRIYVAVLDEAVGLLDAAGIAYRLPIPVPYSVFRGMLLHGGPIAWWIAQIKNGMRKGSYPSMVADVEQGRKTEVAQLNGEVVRLGLERNIATPVATRIVSLTERMFGASPPAYLTPAELSRELSLP